MYYELVYFPKDGLLPSTNNMDAFAKIEKDFRAEQHKFTDDFFKDNLEDSSKFIRSEIGHEMNLDDYDEEGNHVEVMNCYIRIFVKEKLTLHEKMDLVKLIRKNSQFKWRHKLYFYNFGGD